MAFNQWDKKDISIYWQVIYKAKMEAKEKFALQDISAEALEMYREIKQLQERIEQEAIAQEDKKITEKSPF